MVTDFSAVGKDRIMKFCMHVRLLSAMNFSRFGELWLAGSHGGGITSGSGCMPLQPGWQDTPPGQALWGFGIGCRGSMGQSELCQVSKCQVPDCLRYSASQWCIPRIPLKIHQNTPLQVKTIIFLPGSLS